MLSQKLKFIIKGKKQAELTRYTSDVIEISYENMKLKGISNSLSSGYSLRLFEKGRLGFSACAATASLNDLLRNCKEVACFGKKAKFKFPDNKDREIKNLGFLCSKKAKSVGITRLKNICQQVVEELKDLSKKVKISIFISKAMEKFELANTSNFEGCYEKTLFHLGAGFDSVSENNIFGWAVSEAAYNIDKLDVSKLVETLKSDYELSANISRLSKTGRIPVIFSPDTLYFALMALATGLNGKAIVKNVSPLSGKLSRKILNDKFSLFENPFHRYLIGSIPIDDEGVIPKKRFIIKNGVLKSYLLDLDTATELKLQPTGNASKIENFIKGKSYNAPPVIVRGNWEISKGKVALKEILNDIKEGLFIVFSPDIWMGNLASGELAGSVHLGYRIKNGKLVGRVKNCTISTNIYELLGDQLIALSKERAVPRMLSANLYSPYIYCHNISVN